jgi:hypothetical protein
MRGLVRRTWTGAPWLDSLATGPLDLTKLPTMRRQKGKRKEAVPGPDLTRILGYSADPAPGPGGPGDGGADSDAAGSDEDDGVVGGGRGWRACRACSSHSSSMRCPAARAPADCMIRSRRLLLAARPLTAWLPPLGAGGARLHQDAGGQDGGAPPRAEDARRVGRWGRRAGQAGCFAAGGLAVGCCRLAARCRARSRWVSRVVAQAGESAAAPGSMWTSQLDGQVVHLNDAQPLAAACPLRHTLRRPLRRRARHGAALELRHPLVPLLPPRHLPALAGHPGAGAGRVARHGARLPARAAAGALQRRLVHRLPARVAVHCAQRLLDLQRVGRGGAVSWAIGGGMGGRAAQATRRRMRLNMHAGSRRLAGKVTPELRSYQAPARRHPGSPARSWTAPAHSCAPPRAAPRARSAAAAAGSRPARPCPPVAGAAGSRRRHLHPLPGQRTWAQCCVTQAGGALHGGSRLRSPSRPPPAGRRCCPAPPWRPAGPGT